MLSICSSQNDSVDYFLPLQLSCMESSLGDRHMFFEKLLKKINKLPQLMTNDFIFYLVLAGHVHE